MTYIVTFLVLTILLLLAWPVWKRMRVEYLITSARMLEKDLAEQKFKIGVCCDYAKPEHQYKLAIMRSAAEDNLDRLLVARRTIDSLTDSSGIWSYADIWPTGPNQVWAQSEALAAATLDHLAAAYTSRQAELASIDA